jgi:hypothetical protein
MPRITFQVRAETHLGESLKIVGSDKSLGGWNVDSAIELTTSSEQYPLWSVGPVYVSLPLEYKYIKLANDSGVIWEEGERNRKLPEDA